MTNRDKQIVTGAMLVGVGLLVLASASQSNRRVVNASKRTGQRQKQQEKQQPIITEDIDYVEVFDDSPVAVTEPTNIVKQEEFLKTEKWYSKLLFWKWKIWSKI